MADLLDSDFGPVGTEQNIIEDSVFDMSTEDLECDGNLRCSSKQICVFTFQPVGK